MLRKIGYTSWPCTLHTLAVHKAQSHDNPAMQTHTYTNIFIWLCIVAAAAAAALAFAQALTLRASLLYQYGKVDTKQIHLLNGFVLG